MAIAHSTSKRGLKRTYIGTSSAVTGRMVRVTWTDASVVKMTARKEFQMTLSLVSKIQSHYRVESRQETITVPMGATMHLVRSGFEDYYYIVVLANDACTCAAGRVKQMCKHQKAAYQYELMQEETRVKVPVRIGEICGAEEVPPDLQKVA